MGDTFDHTRRHKIPRKLNDLGDSWIESKVRDELRRWSPRSLNMRAHCVVLPKKSFSSVGTAVHFVAISNALRSDMDDS